MGFSASRESTETTPLTNSKPNSKATPNVAPEREKHDTLTAVNPITPSEEPEGERELVLIFADDRIKSHRLVGSGAFGEVHRVHIGVDDTATNATERIIAIKAVHKVKDLEPGDQWGIHNEVKILQWLQTFNHPSIIRIDACRVCHDAVLIYMDFLPKTLADFVGYESVPLNETQLQCASTQLLEAIAFLDDHGIIHCDIKPANVLVDDDVSQIKLVDFGLATTHGAKTRRCGNDIVTLWYRPPELLLGKRTYSGEVDVWAAACTILELNLRHVTPVMHHRGKVRALFPGRDSASQLQLLVDILRPDPQDVRRNLHSGSPFDVAGVARHYCRKALRERQAHRHHHHHVKTGDGATFPSLHCLWPEYYEACTSCSMAGAIRKALTFNADDRPTARDLLCELISPKPATAAQKPPALRRSDTRSHQLDLPQLSWHTPPSLTDLQFGI